jgi:hypothetical protein
VEYKFPISRLDDLNICSTRKRSLGLSSIVRILRPLFVFCIRHSIGKFPKKFVLIILSLGKNIRFPEEFLLKAPVE